MTELFLAFLAQHDDAAWLRVVDRIERSIHPVDRTATRIWFHFFPLALQQLMQRPDAADLARQMTLAGRWRLADQVDSSHWFLYGHQFWKDTKAVVLDYVSGPTAPGSLDLGAQILELAGRISARTGAAPPVVAGMAAVGLRMLQQVGPDVLAAAAGEVRDAGGYRGLSADAVYARRERQGKEWWRFLTGPTSRSSVIFDERDRRARFPIIHSQHVTTAAALDTRDFRRDEPRCSEGPIPVHCRSCSCGTCWIGVLSGGETLSPIDERERDKLVECGVAFDAGPVPIRLACMAQADGPVSIVIPPWNGLLGRVRKRLSSQMSSSR